MNLRTGKKLTRRRWTAFPMPQLGEADGQPSLLTFYDRHGIPDGDTNNPNADLTDAPEEETEEDEPVPEITGVDQEPPTTNNKIRKPQTTIIMNMTSTTEPKKSATQLKKHSRAMMIYSPRKKNLNRY